MQVARIEGPKDKKGKAQYFDRLVINQRATAAKFRVLLIPFHAGEMLPDISATEKNAAVVWNGQRDEIKFVPDDTQRTHVAVVRDGKQILESK